MKKYELTSQVVECKGLVLHRIRALKDFGYIKAGEFGGWIENEDKPFVCNKCFFYDMLPLCPQCSAAHRKDGRNVIFKEVKE